MTHDDIPATKERERERERERKTEKDKELGRVCVSPEPAMIQSALNSIVALSSKRSKIKTKSLLETDDSFVLCHVMSFMKKNSSMVCTDDCIAWIELSFEHH